MSGPVLVLNCGSSSVKYRLVQSASGESLADGVIERVDDYPKALQQVFDERLALGGIVLSAREKEVCLGLLTGGTVPQLAEKLRVKSSSVETYLKRATAKLGVSGRHGLARWMAGA